MKHLVSLGKLFFPDFRKLAKERNVLQVVTISYSHYVELALWSLKLGKVPYDEHGYVPGQHFMPAAALRLGGEKPHLSKSSRIHLPGTILSYLSLNITSF
jgi:hypothetical protein